MRVIELFSQDYDVKTIFNKDGSLCSSYPPEIVIPEWLYSSKENMQKLSYQVKKVDNMLDGLFVD